MLIHELLSEYRAGRTSPVQVMERVLDNIERAPQRNAWVTLLPRKRVLAMAQALVSRSPQELPSPWDAFAIKDNIDLAGTPRPRAAPNTPTHRPSPHS